MLKTIWPYAVTFISSGAAFNALASVMETMPKPPDNSYFGQWAWNLAQRMSGNHQKVKDAQPN